MSESKKWKRYREVRAALQAAIRGENLTAVQNFASELSKLATELKEAKRA